MGGKTRTSYKKGQSGNIRGRPKKGQTLSELIRSYLEEQDIDRRMMRKEVLIEKIYNMSMGGEHPSGKNSLGI